jgi:type II secretory pathway predicted ATPase ExeA
MYKTFYHLKEKPFTLLPDPGFLFLSDKHRMALTLLEYGLTNQAGFTVISGEIGAGKTTLIRYLLNNMDQEFTVGLISNTHRSFGELLEWILSAFNLEHKNMNKVEMYRRFADFIIDEYAHNRRTVLIIDEAQNLDAETLEELRMLSNINADKDQALQIVLSGQRELRDTLRSPELVQFAQRIAVDYHLGPLSAEEVAGYVRHRMEVAGGDPDTFTPKACIAIHRYTDGVPRLINLLCDTALVYGYAEQRRRIDARLITEVAREKQQGGIFPVTVPAELRPEDEEVVTEPEVAPHAVAADTIAATATRTVHVETGAADTHGSDNPATTTQQPATAKPASRTTVIQDKPPQTAGHPAAQTDAEYRWQHGQPKKKLHLAVCAAKASSRQYLSRLLESYGFEVIAALEPDARKLAEVDTERLDVLLIDRDENDCLQSVRLANALAKWRGPVLYNDSGATEASLQQGDADFGVRLAQRIHALAGSDPQTPAAINQ